MAGVEVFLFRRRAEHQPAVAGSAGGLRVEFHAKLDGAAAGCFNSENAYATPSLSEVRTNLLLSSATSNVLALRMMKPFCVLSLPPVCRSFKRCFSQTPSTPPSTLSTHFLRGREKRLDPLVRFIVFAVFDERLNLRQLLGHDVRVGGDDLEGTLQLLLRILGRLNRRQARLVVGRQVDRCNALQRRIRAFGGPLGMFQKIFADEILDVPRRLDRIKRLGHRLGVLIAEHQAAVLEQQFVGARVRVPHELPGDIIVHIIGDAMMVALDVVPRQLRAESGSALK